jgi:CHASE1-domain containing sensor protein
MLCVLAKQDFTMVVLSATLFVAVSFPFPDAGERVMTLDADTPLEQNIPLRRYIPAAVFLFLGLFISFVVTLSAYNWEKETRRLEFESHAGLMDEALMDRFEDYVSALFFLGDFFYNSDYVSRYEFNRFTAGALRRYPAVKSFAWVPLVKDKERKRFEEGSMKEGAAGFEIREIGSDGRLVRSRSRSSYMPVRYIEPMAGNARVLGFDMASETLRQAALLKAGYSGESAVTARINLGRELGGLEAVLLFIPVYHQDGFPMKDREKLENLKGYVMATLVLRDIVDSALSSFKDSGLWLALYDESADSSDSLLVSFQRKGDGMGEALGRELKRHHRFAGRDWRVSITPAEGSNYNDNPYHFKLILFVTLSFTLMLTSYTHQKMVTGFGNEQRMREEIRVKERLEQEVALREKEEAQLRATKQNLEREIKERISLEKQRDRSILELTRALAEVRNLRGILPLCSYCKKIKDDKGRWEQVDVYINKHSQADISHGICPECMKQHHPEEYDEIYGDKNVQA